MENGCSFPGGASDGLQYTEAADVTSSAVVRLTPVLLRLERQDAAEDERVVLPVNDVDAVRVGKADPGLGDRRDGLTVLGEEEVVSGEVSGHLQVGSAGNGDRPFGMERSGKSLTHLCADA